jgi:hypothetical protein
MINTTKSQINQNITVKANPVKHYEDFIINDINNFSGFQRHFSSKKDKYIILFAGICVLSGIVSFYLKNYATKYYFLLFSGIYLFGIFIHAVLVNLTQKQANYSTIISATRKYFFYKYELDKNIYQDYHNSSRSYKIDNISSIENIIFYVMQFIIGTIMIYFAFTYFVETEKIILILSLSSIISLFLCYILYFWYKNSLNVEESE